MKFRLVDRIIEQGDAQSIRTVKAIPFADHGMLEIWGRDGSYPESLLVGLAVESAALLVARESHFTRYALLEELTRVELLARVDLGAVLTCTVRRSRVEQGLHYCAASVTAQPATLLVGEFVVRELELESCYDRGRFALLWSAIHVASA